MVANDPMITVQKIRYECLAFSSLKTKRCFTEIKSKIMKVAKACIRPWIFIELCFKHILSKTGVTLQHSATNNINLALWFLVMWITLLNIWFILNALEYNDNVPKIIEKTPKYCVLDNSSSKKIKENRELNKGEKERRGIVRLRSDSLIDLRKSNAENIPKIIKINPGIKYDEIFT